jgi:hypothetical protein
MELSPPKSPVLMIKYRFTKWANITDPDPEAAATSVPSGVHAISNNDPHFGFSIVLHHCLIFLYP